MHEDEPRVQVGGFAEELGGGVDREDRLFDLGVTGELKPVVGWVVGPAVEFEDLVEEAVPIASRIRSLARSENSSKPYGVGRASL